MTRSVPVIGIVAAALLVVSQLYLTGIFLTALPRSTQGHEAGRVVTTAPPTAPLSGSPINLWVIVGALLALSAYTRGRYVPLAWLGIGMTIPPPHHNAVEWVFIGAMIWSLLALSIRRERSGPDRGLALVLFAAIVGGCVLSAQTTPTASGGTVMSSQDISARVVASLITRMEPNGAEQLELLVLWRGAPGWFVGERAQPRSAGGTSTGGAAGSFEQRLSFGSVTLNLAFDAQSRTLRIQDRTVAVPRSNVIVVDGADDPKRLEVVETLFVPVPASSSRLSLERIFRGTPRLLDFANCDAPFPAARPPRPGVEMLCARLRRP